MNSHIIFKWICIFFLYCLVGWIWETFYVYIRTGHWENRGFLYGPYLPIYGFGAIIILYTTIPFQDNIWLTFIIGMLSATVLEYISGSLMEFFFHTRYWDYSGAFLNLNGHICLSCSLFWGFASIVLVRWIQPWVEQFFLSFPDSSLIWFGLGITFMMLLDVTITIIKHPLQA